AMQGRLHGLDAAHDDTMFVKLREPPREQGNDVDAHQKSASHSTWMRAAAKSTGSTITSTTKAIGRWHSPSTTSTSLAPVSSMLSTRPSTTPARLTTSRPIKSCQ